MFGENLTLKIHADLLTCNFTEEMGFGLRKV